ncbi:MAG: putative rane protein [Pseudonocardiales bacterium]|nr:putative rane protein [Pseudonocardiales bacterium]
MSDGEGDRNRLQLRETYRQQLIDSIGGWTGTVIAAIPPIVFVIVNAVSGLRPAIIAAIGSALLLTAYRLVRRQSVQQAMTGLFGVVVAALIAARTGQARGYFLLGIWSSFVYGGVFAVSILVRRPLVGLLWEFVDPTPGDDDVPWYRRPALLRAYLLATLGATAVFLARGIVQLALFQKNSTGWLAFARIAMGYPLWALAAGFAYWVVTRARKRTAPVTEAETGTELSP